MTLKLIKVKKIKVEEYRRVVGIEARVQEVKKRASR